jgi:uncharacterized protein YcnI
MAMIRNWRMAAVTLGAALAGMVAFAAPAAADVTVTPPLAPKGGNAKLSFQVAEDRPGAYTTKVELVPPEATPIGEIYPMSIDDWAPMTTNRELGQPAELIHGTTTTEVVASITWTRVTPPAPGAAKPVVLAVSLGPMPQAESVAFTVVQTYSDGTVVRWEDAPAAGGTKAAHPAPVVTLVNADPASGDSQGQGNAPAAVADKGGDGGSSGLLTGGLVLGLLAGVGLDGWLIARASRRLSAGAR